MEHLSFVFFHFTLKIIMLPSIIINRPLPDNKAAPSKLHQVHDEFVLEMKIIASHSQKRVRYHTLVETAIKFLVPQQYCVWYECFYRKTKRRAIEVHSSQYLIQSFSQPLYYCPYLGGVCRSLFPLSTSHNDIVTPQVHCISD